MKVLHINSYYSVSIFYKNLYELQIENGLEIDVFVSVPSSYNKSNTNFGTYTNLSNNHRKYDRLFFHLKQYKIYRDIIKKYDIKKYSLIHAHSLFSNGYVAMKLKEKYKIPYIVTVRNTDVNTFFRKMFHLKKTGVQILKNAEYIIYLSESYKDKVIQNYIPDNIKEDFYKKSVVIPNGIDNFWLDNKVKIKSKPDKFELKLLYVGVINKNKNILTTIEAIKILLNKGLKVKLTVVGKIVDKHIYNQLKLLDFVDYIGPQSKEILLQKYRQNDIFVMPSVYESFGLVYAEAMSQGLPVIYTKGQGFDRQFDEGEVGYSVNCFDSKEIAITIEKIVSNYDLLSKNCLNNSDVFSWKDIENKYSYLYANILSTKKTVGSIHD